MKYTIKSKQTDLSTTPSEYMIHAGIVLEFDRREKEKLAVAA